MVVRAVSVFLLMKNTSLLLGVVICTGPHVLNGYSLLAQGPDLDNYNELNIVNEKVKVYITQNRVKV